MPTVKMPDGSVRTFAEGTTPAQITAALSAPPTKQVGESTGEILTGAVADTFSASDRPGAKTSLQVLTQPEGVGEHLIQAAVTAPTIALGGAGAGAIAPQALKAAAPVAGRIATAAGLGAADAAAQGGDPTVGAVLDAAVAGVLEGGAGLAGKGLAKVGKAARAFDWATVAPQRALDALRSRLPTGKWLNVPSLASAKLTVEEAVEALSKKTGAQYQQARAELASEISRLDVQRVTGPKPLAGQVFKMRTAEERFEPSLLSRVAEAGRSFLGSGATRAGAETLATEDVGDPSIPVGVVAGAYGLPWALQQAKRLIP